MLFHLARPLRYTTPKNERSKVSRAVPRGIHNRARRSKHVAITLQYKVIYTADLDRV